MSAHTPGPWRVTADITYLDGALAGLTIPEGYTVSGQAAQRIMCWLLRVQHANDFVRAAVTGNRYTVSNVQLRGAI